MAETDALSPLRYPGSKYALVDYFESLIRENLLTGCEFYEPFAGGASMTLALLSRGVISRGTLVERDPLVYAFWKCVASEPDALCRRVDRLAPSLASWKRFQRYLAPDALERYPLLDLGVAGLFFNRTNFSGIIGAKPIGGLGQRSAYTIDCRFNRESLIERIQGVARYRTKLRVNFGNALTYMRRNAERIRQQGALVYIDPPYVRFGYKLYRYHYRENDHRALAEFVDAAPFKWVVSYDNVQFIRDLFHKQKIVPIFLNYAVRQSRRAEELLIANIPLVPPVYRDAKGNEVAPVSEPIEEPVRMRFR